MKKVFDSLKGIHFQTELLESLDWDEEKLDQTIKELDQYFKENIDTHPAFVKQALGVMFDDKVRNIIFKYIDYMEKSIQQEEGDIDYEA